MADLALHHHPRPGFPTDVTAACRLVRHATTDAWYAELRLQYGHDAVALYPERRVAAALAVALRAMLVTLDELAAAEAREDARVAALASDATRTPCGSCASGSCVPVCRDGHRLAVEADACGQSWCGWCGAMMTPRCSAGRATSDLPF